MSTLQPRDKLPVMMTLHSGVYTVSWVSESLKFIKIKLITIDIGVVETSQESLRITINLLPEGSFYSQYVMDFCIHKLVG